MTATTGLPPSFDCIDLAELLDVIEQLADWLRVGTFDEAEGEREVRDRAKALVARYRRAD
jgi:hypothetical protein